MTSFKSLQDAFHEELKDVYSAEKQLMQALPRIIKKCQHEELKECLEQHVQETEQQIDRLEQVFKQIDRPARARKCEGMQGILEETKTIMESEAEPNGLDAMLIEACQKIEHYEIASYGTLCTWSELLGLDKATELLQATLDEEKATNDKLNKIAEVINEDALQPAGEEEEEEEEE